VASSMCVLLRFYDRVLFVAKTKNAMKQPEFLKNIHIGKIIQTEKENQHLTVSMLAEKVHLKKWVVRDTFKHTSIKINKLIKFSYALGVNFLQIYLQNMPLFGNTEPCEDEVVIKIIDGQLSMIPAKESRTTDFLQSIHIGKLLQAEATKQNLQEEFLSEILCREQSAVSRMYGNSDIDMARLIEMSYVLNYDFIHNIYIPYMAVNEKEIIVNDCISDPCTIKFNPKTISVITEEKTGIYHGTWSQK
jgi:hypothetical protein